jgi:HSP20 family protein
MRTALTRWTPAPDLVRDRFGRIFDEAFSEMLRPLASAEGAPNRSWAPPVDIRETEDHLVLALDLPGLSKEDVNITLENNVLTVSGERRFQADQKNETLHRLERAYGAFTRAFTLGPTVQTDRVEANFQDGVLTIQLPKVEASKPRRIDIK